MIKPEVILEIMLGFPLSKKGTHGVSHWGRVLETGLKIAEENGADPQVIEYFAVFHDARRENEGWDEDHGRRGAALAEELKSMLDLSEAQLAGLKHACAFHTDGLVKGSITVRTCWDADRLDLWRVGTQPGAPYICTESAMQDELLEWAEKRSVDGYIPQCSQEWLRLLEAEL